MSENEIVISDANVRNAPVFRAVNSGGKTYINDYATNAPMYVVDGEIGGGAEVMTTEERTATVPDEGKLIWDSDLNALFVGDGVTSGGNAVGGGSGTILPGYRMNNSGGVMNQDRWFPIDDSKATSSALTISAGSAYKVMATSNGGVTINTEEVPMSKYGLEGHLEIYLANGGYVQTGDNVDLDDALIPDAINNCTVRFRRGKAVISVEDHIAGYIVVSAGSGAKSLPYALSSASDEYVAFAAALNGQTLDMAGAVTNGEKHVVGNGYSATVLTGSVSCTSKTTFSNLGMSGVSILGGTATLGDVFIPSGATVTANGGMIQLEKVTGGVIDYGGSAVTSAVQRFKDVAISGATLTHTVGSPLYIIWNASGTFVSCTFAGGVTSVSDGGGGCYIGPSGNGFFSSCIFSGNSATVGGSPSQVSIRYSSAYAEFKDCTFVGNSPSDLVLAVRNETASATLSGKTTIPAGGVGTTHSDNRLTIADGAVIDMTGNLNSLVFYGNIAATGDFSILYTSSAGADTDIRSFHDLGIQGTTITRLGIIYGATVTIPEDLDGTYYIETTEGTTGVTSADAGDLVISSGGLIGTDKD